MSPARVTRVFGHPLHAILTDFPLALLAVTPLFDLASLAMADPSFALVAYWCELVGLAAATLAALVGVADLVRLESQSPEQTTALRHALCALLAVTVYAVAFVLRVPDRVPSVTVVVIEWVGLLLLGGAGWFGGHLVFRHGVGVELPEQRKDRDSGTDRE